MIDFGVATLLRGSDESGVLRTRVGTPAYMAPELLNGLEYSGVQTDLFASGIVLFFILT